MSLLKRVRHSSPSSDACLPALQITLPSPPRLVVSRRDPRRLLQSATTAYEYLERPIGGGSYGTVFRGRERATGRDVALKCVCLQSERGEGVDSVNLRELASLRSLRHASVMPLLDVVAADGRMWLVLPYYPRTLADEIVRPSRLWSAALVRSLARQLLEGLRHAHERRVVHRDLKPQNLLIAAQGADEPALVIGDWGLSRLLCFAEHQEAYSPNVVSCWYRAPELFLGQTQYGCSLDMWAAGCILFELITRAPLFPADEERNQLGCMIEKLGTGVLLQFIALRGLDVSLPAECLAQYPESPPPQEFWRHFALPPELLHEHAQAFDLLQHLLCFDPEQRWTVQQALRHQYFASASTLDAAAAAAAP